MPLGAPILRTHARHTPRSTTMPPPARGTVRWEWTASRVGADAAPAGPNGVIEALGLDKEKTHTLMCSIHIEREVRKKKWTHFNESTDEQVGKFNADFEQVCPLLRASVSASPTPCPSSVCAPFFGFHLDGVRGCADTVAGSPRSGQASQLIITASPAPYMADLEPLFL